MLALLSGAGLAYTTPTVRGLDATGDALGDANATLAPFMPSSAKGIMSAMALGKPGPEALVLPSAL